MPHGMCYLWRSDLLLLHTLSDAGIALAYFSIPLAIAWFVRKRTDLQFGWLALLFAAFIVACGITHLLGIWVVWNPNYYIEGTAKAVTAAVSILTAALLWPLIPKLVALPSPTQLSHANHLLKEEVRSRQQAESDLRTLNRELEQRVAERTVDLERSNNDLEKFAYHASHDLKAPLRAVNSLSRFIEEDIGTDVSAEITENMRLMRDSVSRMEKMLDDLLEYSRIGQASDKPAEVVSLQRLVDDAVILISPPQQFSITTDASAADVDVPRMPLQQILLNLISNAIEHHDKPTGHIRIVARKDEHTLTVEVSDDGPGIPEKFHNDIFELFRTLNPRSDRRESGMGLAIALRAAQRMNGAITLESEPGEGAKFYISWPLGPAV